MLNNIGSDSLINGSLIQQSDVSGVERRLSATNPYAANKNELIDESDISSEAMSLYQKDQEIQKYKDMVMDSLYSDNGIEDIKNLVQSGNFNINDEDLASSMMDDFDLVSYLF